jgi:putative heme-binding domain-containing protein
MRALTAVIAIRAILALAAGAGLPPARALAQHETAADVLDGDRAFQNSCANCHGPDGDQIPGIDLGRGQFRRSMSDDDLVRIIRAGIPNTPMPPSNMSVEQASKIVAYLRSVARTRTGGVVSGDALRGRLVFDGKGGCASCHRVAGSGSRVGPDLTRIGAQRRESELRRSLVEPGTAVDPTNRSYRVVMRDGVTVTGRLLSHDTFTVQILDSHEQLRSFSKADLREFGFTASPMPSFRNTLSEQELADVVSYLASLKER